MTTPTEELIKINEELTGTGGVVNGDSVTKIYNVEKSTRMFDAYLVSLSGNFTTLSAQADPGDTELTLTSVTGFVDQSYFGLDSGGEEFLFATQIGAPTGSVIDIDTPVDGVFPVGSQIFNLNKNMNVDGSTTAKVFRFGPGRGQIDLRRASIYLQDATEMDDSKFAGGTALEKGIVMRTFIGGIYQNLWNAKSNGDIALICAGDLQYMEKAPAGSYGARARTTYAALEKHGVVIRLSQGDFIELVVQDDLTGLEVFEIMVQGNIV